MLVVISEFVKAPTKQGAYRAGKIAMIARGRCPDYPVHGEDLGDDKWEVLFTERPLKPSESYVNGIRVGMAGAR